MEIAFDIQLDNGSRVRVAGDETFGLAVGDLCVFKKDYCVDCGRIIAIPGELSQHPIEPSVGIKYVETPHVLRKASEMDAAKMEENQGRVVSALRSAACHVEQLELPMKLINAHYSLDGKLVTIQFSSEGRVDFRELVKQLSTALNTRIELRQIGVRDETSAIGGISPCGRPLCCCSFLRDFASINVKMAKEQDLALTPTTISGVCGRLKCCLKFEHEGYQELEKTMPRKGEFCECPDGKGRITDRNLLTQMVTIQLDDTTRVVTVPVCDVRPMPFDKRRAPVPQKTDSSRENGSSSRKYTSRRNDSGQDGSKNPSFTKGR